MYSATREDVLTGTTIVGVSEGTSLIEVEIPKRYFMYAKQSRYTLVPEHSTYELEITKSNYELRYKLEQAIQERDALREDALRGAKVRALFAELQKATDEVQE